MHRYCSCCGNDFNLLGDEVSLLAAAGMPLPEWCLQCRLQLRLTYYNHHVTHTACCAFSGVEIDTIYHPDSGIRAVTPALWFGDETIGLLQGRQFDLSRRFFEQFIELSRTVPKPAAVVLGGENIHRSNRIFASSGIIGGYDLDNCYVSSHCDRSSKLTWCIDCLGSQELDQCIECIDSIRLVGCTGLIRCSNMRDSDLCVDCHDSENLLLCWNLTGKKYCILNRECTREEFFQKKIELGLLRRTDRQVCDEMLEDIIFENTPPEKRRRVPPRTEAECRLIDPFFSRQVDPSAAGTNIESIGVSGSRIHYSRDIYNSTDIAYSEMCFDSNHLFGCSGLRGVQYAIFNCSVTRHEYEQQIKKISSHMRETGEWGRFFPAEHSPFAYNESAAQQFFPLTRPEAKDFGFLWRNAAAPDLNGMSGDRPALRRLLRIPEEIAEIPDEILDAEMGCLSCHKPYIIIGPELFLYRSLNYPVPEICPECRYQRRLELQPAKIVEVVATGEKETIQMFRCIGA